MNGTGIAEGGSLRVFISYCHADVKPGDSRLRMFLQALTVETGRAGGTQKRIYKKR